MSDYLSPMRLPINSELFSSKQKELNQLVGNLKLSDIKEDEQFARTAQRVKGAILLKPVTFQEPTITDHYQTERELPPDFHNLMGSRRSVNVITVEFKFDGSPELFGYSPNGLTFGSTSNMRIYQPAYGNAITVEVELSALDRAAALSSAKAQMEMTCGLIKGNNDQAQQWSRAMEQTIDRMLADKRKELLDFYA